MFSKKIKITSFDLKKKNNKKIKRLFSEILQKKKLKNKKKFNWENNKL